MKASMCPSIASVIVWIFLASIQLPAPIAAYQHDIRVVPDPLKECDTSEQCFTFSECLQTPQEVFKSNVTVQFSAGEYSISNRSSINVSITADNLLITGPDGSREEVHIVCHSRFRFQFVDCVNITLTNLVFTGCGSESLLYSGALIFDSVTTLNLTSVVIQDSHGYGLMGVGISGNITIYGCTFYNNTKKSQSFTRLSMGGNCLLYIYIMKVSNIKLLTIVNIFHSIFANGTAEDVLKYEYISGAHDVRGGGGLAIYFTHRIPPADTIRLGIGLRVRIYNCTFLNNSAQYGGNLLLYIHTLRDFLADFAMSTVNISLINCTIREGKAQHAGGGLHLQIYSYKGQFPTSDPMTCIKTEVLHSSLIANKAEKGGGICITISEDSDLYIIYEMDCLFSRVLLTQNEANKGGAIYAESKDKLQNMYLQNSSIVHNYAKVGSGLYFFVNRWWFEWSLYDDPDTAIVIDSTNFTANEGEVGSAIVVDGQNEKFETCSQSTLTSIVLINVKINENKIFQRKIATAAVHINAVKWIRLKNSMYYNNTGGIYANNSNIYIESNVRFEGNSGNYGGAIQLDYSCGLNESQSFLYFMHSSHLSIVNNRAFEYGGGIGVSEVSINPNVCFYQMDDWNTTWKEEEYPTVEMRENRADISGEDIYGISKINCKLFVSNTREEQELANMTLFNWIFRESNQTLSSVSSIPYRICFCKHDSPKSFCMDTMSKTVFPGQGFTVTAATVGNHRGASPAIVRAQFLGQETELAELRGTQDVQTLGRKCGVLTYSVVSTSSDIQLHLKIDGSQKTITFSAIVNITILPCPLGFVEVDELPKCECMHQLTKSGVVCDINTQSHYCPIGMWIGNFSGSIATHPNCPYDYCKPGRNNVSLTSQDEQCQYNRSGVLCGSCQTGLSLTLGTSQCKKCSSVYSLLFFVFLTAGVVLVFLLLKCNLTVSTGTINGLIFYANVVRANQDIFFPRKRTGSAVSFLSAFIAWLNLDVGIEVCFFNGLTAYSRAWLQFLFPAYIWILVGLMIASSRYSTRMAKLIGDNSIPVLATLFLLSYAKLLRVIIDIASFTTITDVNSDTATVWLIDGNLGFLNVPHIFLFLVVLVAVFLYILPFTTLVLLAPYLQAKSRYGLLRWVRKIKPFLDAYQVPYKDNFQFWTGLLLVVRAILFITFASNIDGDARGNLLAIAISLFTVLLILWNTGRIYRSLLPHVIESFFMLNLGVYTAATLFLASSNASSLRQEYLLSVMVGTAFVVFCGVLAYHFYNQVRDTNCMKLLCSAIQTSKWLWCQLNRKSAATEGETEMDCADNANMERNDQQMHAMCAAPSIPVPTVSVVDITALREPLLTEN